MKRFLAVLVVAVLMVSAFAGCSGGAKYKDGDYSAKSTPDERGNYSEVKITIKDGKIATANYQGYLKDGSAKDENYGKTDGKIENQDNYDKAQNALKGAATYAPKLVETQDVSKVDTVAGATHAHDEFKEAVGKILEQAKK